jgi:hypothetical protein
MYKEREIASMGTQTNKKKKRLNTTGIDYLAAGALAASNFSYPHG